MRVVKSSNEFFDILDKIGNGKYVTIGYVVGSNLVGIPKVKRKNPLTNRMKGYPDHTAFDSTEEIGALVKISSYNMRYSNRMSVNKRYGEWKNSANAIRAKFGLDPIGDKEGYKSTNEYGKNGIETYDGSNEALQGHSYNPQNIYGVRPKSIVYAINQDGHIIKELTPEQVKPYLKQYKERNPEAPSYRDSGANALLKMGAEEEQIKDYLAQLDELKFSYINFEANSILWIAATVDGEKIVYINDNLQRAVDGINIRPEDFRAIARERYEIDLANLHESKSRKNVIRLTEGEFRKIIMESVGRLLREGYNNSNYTHFAVNKATGKIVNGWDYAGEDPEDLRQFKRDYFISDLLDYELNPKEYKILTAKSLMRMGIDPNDDNNWANR